jgi:hypothetical protein
LILSLSDLVPASNDPAGNGCRVDIDLDEAVTERLGKRATREHVVNEVIRELLPQINEKVVAGQSCEFLVPSIAKIRIGAGQHGVRYRLPKNEAQRILRTVKEAPPQLHPEHPGIIVVQSGEVLRQEDVRHIGQALADNDAAHLAAVAVFPAYFGLPEPFCLFSPFYILNRKSAYNAGQLKPFNDLLQAFSKVPVSIS